MVQHSSGLYQLAHQPNLALLRDWRWPHFSAMELACPCAACGRAYYHDSAFLDALEKMRALVGRPITINSAHRCAAHNRAVGGASASWHCRAIAADIALKGHDRAKLLAAARNAGFRGLGFGGRFLHVDLGPARRWTYPGAIKAWVTALGHNPLA